MFKFILFLLLLFIQNLSLGSRLFCQASSSFSDSKHAVGLLYGHGDQNLLNVPYEYTTNYFGIQYNYMLKSYATWQIEIASETQWNQTNYRPIDLLEERNDGYEIGISGGFLFRKFVHQNSQGIYAVLTTGPHYTSGTPERQIKGFLFASSAFIGAFTSLSKFLSLEIRYGFRHISNANLKQPNGGVNQMIWNLGLKIHI